MTMVLRRFSVSLSFFYFSFVIKLRYYQKYTGQKSQSLPFGFGPSVSVDNKYRQIKANPIWPEQQLSLVHNQTGYSKNR